MLGAFRSTYGAENKLDELSPSMRNEIEAGIGLLLLIGVAILVALQVILMSGGTGNTDREVAAASLELAAEHLSHQLEGADNFDPERVENKQYWAGVAIGADVEFTETTASGKLRTIPDGERAHLRCRIEWEGRAPQFEGTRIVAMNSKGGEVATLTVKDLSDQEWQVETVTPFMFWR